MLTELITRALSGAFESKSIATTTDAAPGSLSPAMLRDSIYAELSAAGDAPMTDLARIKAAEAHPIVMACVRKIAWAAATVPLGVEMENGDLSFDHPLAQRIAAPRCVGGKTGLMQQVAASLAICGRAYIHGVPSAFRGDPPAQLVFLRSDRIQRIPNSDGTLAGWRYQAGQLGSMELDPSTVCEIRHPWLTDNNDFGISVVDPIAFSNVTPSWSSMFLFQGLSSLINKILTNNAGMPGILAWGNGAANAEPLTDQQKKTLKDYFDQYRAGNEKFGKIALVDVAGGKLDFIKITADLGDLKAIENKADAAREICSIFGVPNLILNVGSDTTYANQAEARRYFWTDTVMPGYCDPIAAALSAWFGVTIKADYTSVPALADYQRNLAGAIAQMHFLTINEKRQMMGYPKVMGGDIVMTTPAEIPINRLLDTNGNNLSDETDGWVYNQEMIRQYLQGRRELPIDDHAALNNQHAQVPVEVGRRTQARIAARSSATEPRALN